MALGIFLTTSTLYTWAHSHYLIENEVTFAAPAYTKTILEQLQYSERCFKEGNISGVTSLAVNGCLNILDSVLYHGDSQATFIFAHQGYYSLKKDLTPIGVNVLIKLISAVMIKNSTLGYLRGSR